MKQTIKLFSLVLVFCIGFIGQLNAIEKPTFSLKEGRTLIIELNDWNDDQVTLEVLDINMNKLYSDILTQDGTLTKEYDLDKFHLGEYFLVLFTEDKRSISSLSVNLGNVEIEEVLSNSYFEPQIEISRKSLSLDYLAYGEYVNVSIIGRKGVVYTSSFEGERNLSKKINISNLEKGNYVLVLNSKSKNFRKGFHK